MSLRSRLIRMAASLPPDQRSPVLQVLASDTPSLLDDQGALLGAMKAIAKNLERSRQFQVHNSSWVDANSIRETRGFPRWSGSSADIVAVDRDAGKIYYRVGLPFGWNPDKERLLLRAFRMALAPYGGAKRLRLIESTNGNTVEITLPSGGGAEEPLVYSPISLPSPEVTKEVFAAIGRVMGTQFSDHGLRVVDEATQTFTIEWGGTFSEEKPRTNPLLDPEHRFLPVYLPKILKTYGGAASVTGEWTGPVPPDYPNQPTRWKFIVTVVPVSILSTG